MVDLEELYGSIECDPCVFEDGGMPWRIDGSTFPVPPDVIRTSELVISCGERFSDWVSYGNRNDLVSFFAARHTYRSLGYLLLANLFAGSDHAVSIHLTNPRSQIKRVVLDSMDPEPDGWVEGLYLRPHVFGYVCQPIAKFPFEVQDPGRLECVNNPYDLPRFIVISEEPNIQSADYWLSRDTLRICPSFIGTTVFAQLLLDVSFSQQEIDECHLHSHPMFQAVAPGSAELSIWLPGSFGWYE